MNSVGHAAQRFSRGRAAWLPNPRSLRLSLSASDHNCAGSQYRRRVSQTPDGASGAIDRAADYIQGHGGPFQLARFHALFAASPPALQINGQALIPVEPEIAQNSDGGWPAPWSEGASSLDATCFLLDQLSDFAQPPPTVDVPAAVAFLGSVQLDDGTWREGPSHRTPDWLMPGSAAARVYLTANCARTLVVYHGQDAAIERAAQALEWSLDPHGRLPGPLVAHWLAARVLRATARNLAARRLLDVVGRSFDQLDAAELAGFGSNTPRDDRWTRRIMSRLVALQEADGAWRDEDGEPSVELSVTACRVLLRHTA